MTKIKNNGLCKEKAKMSIKEEMKQAKWRMLQQYLRLNVNSLSKKAMNFYFTKPRTGHKFPGKNNIACNNKQ